MPESKTTGSRGMMIFGEEAHRKYNPNLFIPIPKLIIEIDSLPKDDKDCIPKFYEVVLPFEAITDGDGKWYLRTWNNNIPLEKHPKEYDLLYLSRLIKANAEPIYP